MNVSGEAENYSHRQWVEAFAVASILILMFGVNLWKGLHSGSVFQDARVYLRGVREYQSGGNPYKHFAQLNFVGTPLFLRIASVLVDTFPLKLLAFVYLALNSLAAVSVPFVLAVYYLRCRWLTPAVAVIIFAFHPLMTAAVSIATGNISCLMYGAVLAAGVFGVRRNRWWLFYIVVACCSILKLPLLTLLLLPLLLSEGQFWMCLATAVAALTEMLVERLVWPAQYNAFLASATYQVSFLRDCGYGFSRYFYHFNIGARIPLLGDRVGYVAQVLVMGAIVYGLWRRTQSAHPPTRTILVAAVIVTAILASPRMMPYDAFVAIVPAALLIVEGLRTLRERHVSSLLIATPIAFLLVLVHRSEFAANFVLLLAAVLLVVAGLYTAPTESVTLSER